MAEDYRSIATFPTMKKITLSSTGNEATEIKLPKQAARIQIGAESVASKIASTGTDASAIDADHMFIPSGNIITIRLGRGSTRIDSLFVASASSGAVISLILEEL